MPQAYFNSLEGIRRITTETGAGQWGCSMAYAAAQFGLTCTVYMVRVSYNQKPYRAAMMRAWGAECIPSPSDRTKSGRAALAEDPETNGSLGIAISEAVEDAIEHDDAHYALGSVLNHVLLHQTVVGLEARKQFEIAGRWPDVLVACCGGGSNFAGFAFPFLPEKLDGSKKLRLVGVEPAACPTLTRGKLAYDYGDTAGLTPLMRMYTLGAHFMPPGFHAGGLRYHGMRRWFRRPSSRAWPSPSPSRSSIRSPRACSLPRPKASCRRPSRATPCAARSSRPNAASAKTKRKSSRSTSPATATWT